MMANTCRFRTLTPTLFRKREREIAAPRCPALSRSWEMVLETRRSPRPSPARGRGRDPRQREGEGS
jgi:hypothetical protein